MEYSIPDLLTREEFAARARCSPRKATQLLHGPDGPRVTKIGGTLFVRVDHFKDWLERLSSPPSPMRDREGGADSTRHGLTS
jgi:hypothetical protein